MGEMNWLGMPYPLPTTEREWASLTASLKEIGDQLTKVASESNLRINRKEEPTYVGLSYLSSDQVVSLGAFFANSPSEAQKMTLFRSIADDAKEQDNLAGLDLDLESVLSPEDYRLWQNMIFWA